MTPLEQTLSSDVAIPDAVVINCQKCPARATRYWPTVHGSKPEAYCLDCLEKAKAKLLCATGVVSY